MNQPNSDTDGDKKGRGERPLNLREAQKQLTVSKLLEASRTIFHANGYAVATVDDIVEEAGASRATFYLYFASKGHALEELFNREHVDAVLKMLERFPSDPTVESLREWISGFLELYSEQQLTIRAWIQAGSRESEFRDDSLKALDHVLDNLSEHVQAIRLGLGLETSDESARTRALLMFISMHEFAYYEHIRNYPVNRKLGLELLAELWHAAIFGQR